MGYTTEFRGRIDVEPPLSTEEIAYLQKFSETRRMDRRKGPYFIGGTGEFGQHIDADVISGNLPPEGQPGLWCNWIPTASGDGIEWNGAEKFYEADEWMKYLIEHFIGTTPKATTHLPFLKGHICNGVILAQGEDISDRWQLIVTENAVSKVNLT